MEIEPLREEIAFIADHIFGGRQEEAVRRWTDAECDDYQLALAFIISFLRHAGPPLNEPGITTAKRPQTLVAAEIIRNSRLHQLLEVETSGERISVAYRADVPTSLIKEISRFACSKSQTISD